MTTKPSVFRAIKKSTNVSQTFRGISMALNPFPPAPVANPTQQLGMAVSQIRSGVSRAGSALLNTYNQLQTLVNANPYGLTAEQITTALGADAAQLEQFASIVKGVVNTIAPGTITDSILPYTLTPP
jgi:hypothetical protein